MRKSHFTARKGNIEKRKGSRDVCLERKGIATEVFVVVELKDPTKSATTLRSTGSTNSSVSRSECGRLVVERKEHPLESNSFSLWDRGGERESRNLSERKRRHQIMRRIIRNGPHHHSQW